MPVLTVTRAAGDRRRCSIDEATWVGMRVRVCADEARPSGARSTCGRRPATPAPSKLEAPWTIARSGARRLRRRRRMRRRGGVRRRARPGRRAARAALDNDRREDSERSTQLDRLAAEAFEGYLVRKDLAHQFRGQYPVPTYVGEFLLGRYCARPTRTRSPRGWQIVERQLQDRTVRAGEEELFKSRARENGRGQDHRPHHGPPRREDRLLHGRAAEPAAQRRPHRRRARRRATSGC